MKRFVGWAVLGALLWAPGLFAADLSFLERFALAEDRAEVLKELVPGTEEYYYFTCLYYQQSGKFSEVDELLTAWAGQHGETAEVTEIRNRQALLRYAEEPEKTLDYLVAKFGLTFDHEPHLPGAAPDLPTALDPDLISRGAFLKRAQANALHQDDIQAFRPAAYEWLLAADLSDGRLRALLDALDLPGYARLPELIAKDLDAPDSRGFGSLQIHRLLLKEQLDGLLSLKPGLLDNEEFINAYVQRLAPGDDDARWEEEPAQVEAYLERLWAFVQRLSPAHISLKAHVLYRMLEFDQRQGIYNETRFMQYIQIPRRMGYVDSTYLREQERVRFTADLEKAYSTAYLPSAIRYDEELIQAYLRHFFAAGRRYDAFRPYIREDYLRQIYAETMLLQGEGDLEQWYSWLDSGAVEQLKERVDVAFAQDNLRHFGIEEPVSLALWIKNVDRLMVKVYEIDTQSYYQHFNRDLNTDIDLDGLVANHEQVHEFDAPPLRRARHQFDFPELTGRGAWIVEFVGNGASVRAIVEKGALQYATRVGPAGQIFTVYNEAGERVPNASIWFGEKTYEANENGEITLPFAAEDGTSRLLLSDGSFATRMEFRHLSERYHLEAGFYVDRESLRTGRVAQVAVRPRLSLQGAPLPMSLLDHVRLTIRSRTHDGIESVQDSQDLDLSNSDLAVQEFRVPDNLANLTVTLTGTIDPLTTNEPVVLSQSHTIAVNGIHSTTYATSLFLSREEDEHFVEFRDKSGNPIADRAVRLELHHREFSDAIQAVLKTDDDGRIALGKLPDIVRISARADGPATETWQLGETGYYTYPQNLNGVTGTPILMPLMGETGSAAVALFETRSDIFVKDYSDALSVEDGYLVIDDVPPGNYLLHLKRSGHRIRVRISGGVQDGHSIVSNNRILEGTLPTPLQVQSVEPGDDAIQIQIAGANSYTRVHVVGTYFHPEASLFGQIQSGYRTSAVERSIGRGAARYSDARQIGDEYRYVLERRFAEKFPGNMLERPSLLLNPWSLQETTASQDDAAKGEPPPPAETMPQARQIERGDTADSPAPPPVDASPCFDFLPGDAAVLYNLQPDESGVVTIPRGALQGRAYLQIVATDPLATVSRIALLPAQDWEPNDLRLAASLDTASHVVEKKRVAALASGETLEISLTGEAGVQVYDSVPKVLGLFTTLNGDAKLKEFSFLGRWPQLSAEEKAEKFSEFESHELNFFLYHKDRAFFDGTVKPYLTNKYRKTFMDRWLLEEDLSAYLATWELDQLNVVEKILLAKRLPVAASAVTPFVRDGVAMIPPNPGRDNHLFMTALYGGALGKAMRAGFEVHNLVLTDVGGDPYGPPGNGGFGGGGVGLGGGGFGASANGVVDSRAAEALHRESLENFSARMEEELRNVEQDSDKIRRYVEASPAPKPEPKAERTTTAGKEIPFIAGTSQSRREREDSISGLLFDGLRQQYIALYSAPETTKALVENDYYERSIHEVGPGMIPVNRFWLDYVEGPAGEAFLSLHLAEAASSATEALLALAVLDLPYEAPHHQTERNGTALSIRAAGPGIAYYKDIDTASAQDSDSPLLVSQNFFRVDDRYRHEGNQQFDKFIADEFLTGVTYGCQVTVTNPSSAPLQIEVLRQVPAGALPVNSGRYTKSEPLALGPYSTTRLEYFFYFPKPGEFAHYPVHVSREGTLLAYAEPVTLKVLSEPATVDTTSWQYVSQQGTPEQVLEYLRANNLNRLDLNLLRWRMKDEGFYRKVIALLEGRLHFNNALWSYAFLHQDEQGMRAYLQNERSFTRHAGVYLKSPLLAIDPVDSRLYQHIEYAPLLNPRAHDMEGKWLITNAQLTAQYTGLMNIFAHKPDLGQEDLLALCYYLLLQDRVGEALDYFGQLTPDALETRVQYDYLDAYLHFYRETPAEAAKIAANYGDYPVGRWRERFAEVASQAAEIAGAAAGRPSDGPLAQDALAATEPRLGMEIKEDALVLYYDNLESCTVSFYPIDLEMLFTRSPFALAGSDLFAGVKPQASQEVALDPAKNQMAVPLPADLAQRHVVIKAEAAGISRSDIRYASALVAQAIERYGQVRVARTENNKPLSKVYVKAFARLTNGETVFYRDGYTDLRGRFDYASSSTMDLNGVSEFALLVLSDELGARVLTVSPPAR